MIVIEKFGDVGVAPLPTHHKAYRNLTGVRFGKLVCIRPYGRQTEAGKHKRLVWECKCDCGTVCIVRGGSLKHNLKKSCGCLQPLNKLPSGEAAFNAIYRNIKRGAKARDYLFSLTKEEVKVLTSANCYYCGNQPRKEFQRENCNSGTYKWNGIDRINNTIGYLKDNCVTCCYTCNRMKWARDYNEFLSTIKAIYKNRCL